MKTTNLITKKMVEVTCKSTRKTPERQLPLIQKSKGDIKVNKLPAHPKNSEVKNIKHFSELGIILQEATTKNQLRVIEINVCNIARKKCTINCSFTLLHYAFLEISLYFNFKILRIYHY